MILIMLGLNNALQDGFAMDRHESIPRLMASLLMFREITIYSLAMMRALVVQPALSLLSRLTLYQSSS